MSSLVVHASFVSLVNAAGERISKEEFLKSRQKVKVEEKPKVLWNRTLNMSCLSCDIVSHV
jgi:hypothetical protein